jgi:hypothetical protein
MAAESNLEQHFILRVQNAELAAKLRGWLRDQATVDNMSLVFDQCELTSGRLARHAAAVAAAAMLFAQYCWCVTAGANTVVIRLGHLHNCCRGHYSPMGKAGLAVAARMYCGRC